MANVYISLGSNLGNKQINLERAIELLQNHAIVIEQKSTIYDTKPWGFESFNNFLNQVVLVTTRHSPQKMLNILLDVEHEMGRNRNTEGYEDRIIDLDILFYDDLIRTSEKLVIPHPRIQDRLFMLEPMAEINPDFLHPTFHKSIRVLLSELRSKSDNS